MIGLKSNEAALAKSIHQALTLTGKWLGWINKTGALPAIGRGGKTYPLRYGLGVGGADLVGILRSSGRFVAFEVKTERGRETPEQLAWAKAVRDAGGYVATVRSVDDAMTHLGWSEDRWK
jgi:hypothetical protein